MSSNLKRKLQISIRNSLPQCNIKVILKSTKRLSALFRFKDVIPKKLRSHLIYKFSCSSCNATYYGKTERHLNVRSGEHISLSPLTGNRVACKPSAISEHLLVHMATNLSRMVNYLPDLLHIKSHDPLITQSREITRQTN